MIEKPPFYLTFMLLLIFPICLSFGQEEAESTSKRRIIAAGISLFSSADAVNFTNSSSRIDDSFISYSNNSFSSIYFTVDFSKKFRFETAIGLAKVSQNTYSFIFGSLSYKHRTEKTQFLFGVKYGTRVRKFSSGDFNQDNHRIGPIIGGEYFIEERLSIGTELGLMVSNFNSWSKHYDTNTIILLRYYIR